MNVFDHPHAGAAIPMGARPMPAFMSAAGRALAALLRGILQARRRRMAVRALVALDDRALKDVGLHRSEILSAVIHGGPGDRR